MAGDPSDQTAWAPVAASLLGVAVCVLGICRPRRHRRPADRGDPAAEALSKFEVKAAPPAERRTSAEVSRKRLGRPAPTAAWREFVPTEQWQEVADDHLLPPGLHIRVDVTTGRKEARTLPG